MPQLYVPVALQITHIISPDVTSILAASTPAMLAETIDQMVVVVTVVTKQCGVAFHKGPLVRMRRMFQATHGNRPISDRMLQYRFSYSSISHCKQQSGVRLFCCMVVVLEALHLQVRVCLPHVGRQTPRAGTLALTTLSIDCISTNPVAF